MKRGNKLTFFFSYRTRKGYQKIRLLSFNLKSALSVNKVSCNFKTNNAKVKGQLSDWYKLASKIQTQKRSLTLIQSPCVWERVPLVIALRHPTNIFTYGIYLLNKIHKIYSMSLGWLFYLRKLLTVKLLKTMKSQALQYQLCSCLQSSSCTFSLNSTVLYEL